MTTRFKSNTANDNDGLYPCRIPSTIAKRIRSDLNIPEMLVDGLPIGCRNFLRIVDTKHCKNCSHYWKWQLGMVDDADERAVN